MSKINDTEEQLEGETYFSILSASFSPFILFTCSPPTIHVYSSSRDLYQVSSAGYFARAIPCHHARGPFIILPCYSFSPPPYLLIHRSLKRCVQAE